MKKYKIAVLDDYQNVTLDSADWSSLRDLADIAVFQDHLADPSSKDSTLFAGGSHRTIERYGFRDTEAVLMRRYIFPHRLRSVSLT